MDRIERIFARLLFGLAILFITLMTATAAYAHPTSVLRVTDDLGGMIGDYVTTIRWLGERGYTVELVGECASACTLFTLLPKTCVVEGTELWFHAPFKIDRATGQKIITPESVKAITGAYPLGIRKWITSKGGLTADWLILKGKELYGLVPLCGNTPTN